MITIEEKKNCAGCTACACVCPKNCIKMVEDEEGFLYPQVDKEQCIQCGLCEKICPVTCARNEEKKSYPTAYLGYENNDASRKESAAGGAFYSLAKMFIEQKKGVVFGVIYDDNFKAIHSCAQTVQELKKMQRSKYVQSDLGSSFLEVKKYLGEGRYVMFSGTPCQIYGLKAFLRNVDTKNLYCIDLSCHGVPSPKLLREYLKYQEKEHDSKIADFRMRDKRLMKDAYEQGFGIDFKNGETYFGNHTEDLYARCFWGEIASRPSCYECVFKTIWRISDLTLGDCWFFERFVRKEKDNLGVTMVLVQSEKGKMLLDEMENFVMYEVDAERLIKANGGMIYESAKMHPERKEFFEQLGQVPFEECVKNFFPDKPVSKKTKLKRMLENKGIRLEFLRKISRNRRLERIISESRIPEASKGIKKV